MPYKGATMILIAYYSLIIVVVVIYHRSRSVYVVLLGVKEDESLLGLHFCARIPSHEDDVSVPGCILDPPRLILCHEIMIPSKRPVILHRQT